MGDADQGIGGDYGGYIPYSAGWNDPIPFFQRQARLAAEFVDNIGRRQRFELWRRENANTYTLSVSNADGQMGANYQVEVTQPQAQELVDWAHGVREITDPGLKNLPGLGGPMPQRPSVIAPGLGENLIPLAITIGALALLLMG